MPRCPALLSVPLALEVSRVALVVASLLTVAPAARADDAVGERSSAHYSVRAELGGELDTNAQRSEVVHVPGAINPSPIVSPLARAVIAGTISDVLGDNHQVAMAATVATKIFTNPQARGEDVAIVDASALWRKPFGQRWAAALTSGYYEAFQRDVTLIDFVSDRRDFRSVTPTLRLSRALGDHVDAGVGAGYRLFVFKPDHSFDFQAPTAVLDARWARETADGAADWEVAFRSGYERRLFAGRQLVDTSGTCTLAICLPTTGPEDRRDHFLTSALDVSRTGRFLMGAGYGLHVNLSNSFGETVLRHIATFRFAAALPFDLYLAARIEVLITFYADPIYVAAARGMPGLPYRSIEDENRNSARLELSRNLTDRLQLIARYTLYANELSKNDVTYRRQTALLSLSFALEK